MRNTILWLLAVAVALPGLMPAQERIADSIDPLRTYDGTLVYKKTTLAAKVLEFAYPAKDLEAAVGDYFRQRGGTPRKSQGLTSVTSVSLHQADNRAYDVYYQVQRKGSGKSALSTLAVIVAEPGEDILARRASAEPEALEASLPAIFETPGAQGFFSSLGAVIAEHDYGRLVATSEKELRAAESRYNKLVSKGKSLERQREKLERQIAANLEEQNKQAREIDLAKFRLDRMKSRGR